MHWAQEFEKRFRMQDEDARTNEARRVRKICKEYKMPKDQTANRCTFVRMHLRLRLRLRLRGASVCVCMCVYVCVCARARVCMCVWHVPVYMHCTILIDLGIHECDIAHAIPMPPRTIRLPSRTYDFFFLDCFHLFVFCRGVLTP